MDVLRLARLRRFAVRVELGAYGCGGGAFRTVELRCRGNDGKVTFETFDLNAWDRPAPVTVRVPGREIRELLGTIGKILRKRDEPARMSWTSRLSIELAGIAGRRARELAIELATDTARHEARDLAQVGPEPFDRVFAVSDVVSAAWSRWGGPGDAHDAAGGDDEVSDEALA